VVRADSSVLDADGNPRKERADGAGSSAQQPRSLDGETDQTLQGTVLRKTLCVLLQVRDAL
jgi:hypothetical protein